MYGNIHAEKTEYSAFLPNDRGAKLKSSLQNLGNVCRGKESSPKSYFESPFRNLVGSMQNMYRTVTYVKRYHGILKTFMP